ncbi:MAG: hypothetical protein O7C55_04940, partial [Rickettsia endosymbiont of Ixodes persulcatus]|nr:hypothetical protein [Rickettsia endosymbiont of Ixodes persulcatus]
AKSQTIFAKMSYRNGALEKILKKELEEIRISIKDDVISEISKLERNITDRSGNASAVPTEVP